MLAFRNYDRERALEYARKWALDRNPLFFDFTGRGGNCTNFVSQCLLAGSCVMDKKETFGWYYVSATDRAPAWTGVQPLYDFLTGSGDFPNKDDRSGPVGVEVGRERLTVGDVIQLANNGGRFYHTLFVSGFLNGDILVSAQSDDSLDRPLSSYNYAAARYIRIEGVNIETADASPCFEALLSGSALPPPSIVFVPTKTDRA